MGANDNYVANESCKETVNHIYDKISDIDDKHDRKKTYWVNRGMVALCVAFLSIFSGYMYINACAEKQDAKLSASDIQHASKSNENKEQITQNQQKIIGIQKDIEYIRKAQDRGILEQREFNEKILNKLEELKQ